MEVAAVATIAAGIVGVLAYLGLQPGDNPPQLAPTTNATLTPDQHCGDDDYRVGNDSG